jgi:hypothetical protein
MKKFFITLIALTAFLSLHAQTLTGKVVNEDGEPLAFANVVLMDADSAFITGNVTNDSGVFHLNRTPDAFMLNITYLGYTKNTILLKENQTDLGTIRLHVETAMLNEVVIKGNLPKTRIKGDAIVTNVSGTLLEKAGTALDVLSMIPGILLKGEDINVFGRGTPEVYINGRKVRDVAELHQLNSDNIRSVEVITNPGARYDKTVKAVLRIQTRKRTDDGLGFADRTMIGYNNKWSYQNQLDLYFRQNRLDMSGILSFSDQSSWRNLNAIQQTYLDRYWEQQIRTKQEVSTQQLSGKMFLNYTIQPEHSFGASYHYQRSPKLTNDIQLFTDINQDYSFFEQSQGLIGSKNSETRQEGNIYYSGEFGKWEVNFDATWLNAKEDIITQTAEKIQPFSGGNISNAVHTHSDTRNTLHAGKVILSYPLWDGTFAIGGEYSRTSRKSLYKNYEHIVSDDDSRIRENLAAAFAEYEYKLKNITLHAGLHFENVGFDYFRANIYQSEQSKNYTNWFPALSFSMPVGQAQVQLSYTSDITRPNYQMLRSRIDYVNRYTYESGNPFLHPAITNMLTAKATYKCLQFYADYQYNKNAFIPFSKTYSEQDPTIALLSSENAPDYDAINLMFVVAPTIGKWSPQWGLEMYQQWYTVEKPGTPSGILTLDRPSFAVRWRNVLQLPLGFSLFAEANWEGRSDQENATYEAVWWMKASLHKECCDSRLTFLLQSVDIFNSYRTDYRMYYGHIRSMNMNEKSSHRAVTLTIQYKFNTKKTQYKGTGAGDGQKDRL